MPAHFLALLGHPVAQTLSPTIHRVAAKGLGFDIAYVAFDVAPERLADAIRGLRALGAVGANLTIPHKEAAVALVEELTPLARRIGAINVLNFENGRIVGDNTDAPGFVEAVSREGKIEPAGCTAAIVGAGGAGRSVAFGLAEAGAARLILANRTRDRAEALAKALRAAYSALTVEVADATGDEGAAVFREADIVANATRLGLGKDDPSPLTPAFFGNGKLAVETIYSSPSTPFLAAAKSSGARTLDGLAMLVAQGALAFEQWTGHAPSRPAMRRAAEEERAQRTPSREMSRPR